MKKLFTLDIAGICNPMIERISGQRHLIAIRDSISVMVPFLVIASIFLMLAQLPFPSNWNIAIWLASYEDIWQLPYQFTMGCISLYMTFYIAKSLAQAYHLDEKMVTILSIIGLGMMLTPYLHRMSAMALLGGSGMMAAAAASIITAELCRLIEKLNLTKLMEKVLPSAMAHNFYTFLPGLLLILFWFVILFAFQIDLMNILWTILKPILWYVNSLAGILTVIFLTCLFWVVGVHGVNVIAMIFRPFWIILLSFNMGAVVSHQDIAMIGTELFFQWFVWLGGSGMTIGLAILSRFFAKSKQAKQMGRVAFSSAICNVNEPLIFGVPITMNPQMALPFFLAPTLAAIIAWGTIKLGWISVVYATMPWTLPAPLGAFLATGCDIRALALSIILMLLSVAIYYPFFRRYDQALLQEEEQSIK